MVSSAFIIHYLSGCAVLIDNNGVEALYYGYTDNQGSLIALTNETGTVVEKYAYDPWGARRNATDWTAAYSPTTLLTNRGYTGHEHLDLFNIINMNGRVYDPATAMFFSPDPFVQSPGDWKNYNRYSYCMNNPTRYIDPSGYRQKSIFTALDYLLNNTADGGTWTSSGSGGYGSVTTFSNQDAALSWGAAYNDSFNSWAYTESGSRAETVKSYNIQRAYKSGQTVLVGFKGDDNQYSMYYLDKATGKFYVPGTSLESDPYSMYNIYDTRDKTWDALDKLKTGLDAFGALNSIGINIAHDYVATSGYFKSATTWQKFDKLASNQQNYRATRVFGKNGARILRNVKGLGVAAAVATTAYSLTKTGVYLYNGGNDNRVLIKTGLDLTMTVVGFCGPIGFGISTAYFILDTATDGFGGYGKIE
jgi:RHS repeat-associated protein